MITCSVRPDAVSCCRCLAQAESSVISFGANAADMALDRCIVCCTPTALLPATLKRAKKLRGQHVAVFLCTAS